jgi:hypothetical protein
MIFRDIKFGAIIPQRGFRWIFRDKNGNWSLKNPPSDWSDNDDSASQYYVATSLWEAYKAIASTKEEFGPLVSAPDLYLRFASATPTPDTILDFANQYGLLKNKKSQLEIKSKNATDILTAFEWGKHHAESDCLIWAESASDWANSFELAKDNIQDWADIEAENDYKDMRRHLDQGFNYAMQGSLTYQVRIDTSTGERYSEVIASSLYNFIDIQWAMSITANVVPRKCTECLNWFEIHPGFGRPEKLYCSDACRMRAYRKRKK